MTTARDILKSGEQVFIYSWQSAPTKTGTESVYRLNEQYYALMSYGGKPVGPYPTLWEVVKDIGLDEVNTSIVALTCTELPADQLAVRLRTKEGPGHTFPINGEPWAISDGHRIVPST